MHQTVRERKEADFVVCGGGGSGLTAAVRAAQLSGGRVVVLEKLPKPGGGAQFAACMRTFESKWQQRRDLASNTADYIRKVQDEMYWRIDPELALNAVLGTGRFFDWLLELDPSLEDQFTVGKYIFPNEFDPDGPQADRTQPRVLGKIVTDTLLDACGRFDVELLTRHRAMDFEVEGGRVVAVVAEGPDGRVRIPCKACVLATGSWIMNAEVGERVFPGYGELFFPPSPHLSPAYTGDGIPLAERAGAFIDRDSFCFRFMGPMAMLRSDIFRAMIQSKFIITVNLNGKRYCSEPLSHMGYFEDGPVQAAQPKGFGFHIFDMACVEAASRLPRVAAPTNSMEAEVFGSANVPEDMALVRTQLEEALSAGEKNVFRADTIEGLAEACGIDAAGLVTTIARYNAFCAEGFDRDFVKPSDALVALEKPPFYAVKATLGTDGAFGGVLVDPQMRAYAADRRSTVEGLYVTGDFASGRFINYGGTKRQLLNDLAWAFSSGFIAGSHAGGYIAGE